MNIKTTAFLVVAAIAIGIVVYVNPFDRIADRGPQSPWFYQVGMDDIEFIAVTHKGQSSRFYKTSAGTWSFEDPPGIPPDHNRWGGMTLLLSGPQTRRDLTEARPTIDDPAQYGLDNPHTIVDVGIKGNRSLQFRLGDTTSDRNHHYAQVIGFDQLFIIASTWGDVITRLATEPPVPKWYIKRDPATIAELNIYQGDPSKETTPVLMFQNKEGEGWLVRDLDNDPEARPVDPERWKEIEPLVSGPDPISVAVPLVDDRDYAPWGITDDSTAVEIRFSGTTERGTRFIDGILLRLGNKTPDGTAYYAKNESTYSREPVLQIGAQWIDKVLGLVSDVPYAKDTTGATASGQSPSP